MRDSSLFRSNDADDAAAVVAKLDDSDGRVREAVSHVRLMALDTLGKLEAAALAELAPAIAAKLEHRSSAVRLTAVEMLGKLDAATLANHAPAVMDKLKVNKVNDSKLRRAAVATLSKLEAAVRAEFAPAMRHIHQDAVARLKELEAEWNARASA